MNDPTTDDLEAEKKRQKRKMTKILIKAWNQDPNPFLRSNDLTASDKENHKEGPMDLSTMGEMLDAGYYSSVETGWERFALDLTWIYRRFIIGGKHSNVALQHLEEVQTLFANMDLRLPDTVQGDTEEKPTSSSRKKRSVPETVKDTEKHHESPKKKGPRGKKKAKMQRTQREVKSEVSKLQKELDKALKAHDKASKALDAFLHEKQEGLGTLDEERILGDDDTLEQGPNPRLILGNYDPDILQELPSECAPDVLMIWDFLCTFSRTLSLEPIDLQNFVKALLYAPPNQDQCPSPPIFMAEAHLALLKLLLSDTSSDEWWWFMDNSSETQTFLGQTTQGLDPSMNELRYSDPVIKIDILSLLSVPEDPLVTHQWLNLLDTLLGDKKMTMNRFKGTLKRAAALTCNKFVILYLLKCFQRRKILTDNAKRDAIGWLVTCVRQARLDLVDHHVEKNPLMEHIQKISHDATELMDLLQEDEEEEDVDMDALDDTYFDESDEESESEDEVDSDKIEDYRSQRDHGILDSIGSNMDSAQVSSSLPELPARTLVDLILPSNKQKVKSDVMSAFTWPALAGITAKRFLHRLKWLRNEVDDSLRAFHEKPKITLTERRRRESIASLRILSESISLVDTNDLNPLESAISHLCDGKPYLDLSPLQRLCILRLLIEASYDTNHIYNCIQDNIKSRTTAEKSLEQEERQAKKEAKEEAALTEEAARSRLLEDAKRKFVERKRNELTRNHKRKRGYSDEQIKNFTDEEICSLDESTKTEFNAIDSMSFSKAEISLMVSKINDENAFGKRSVQVLTLEEIQKREEKELADMLDELASYSTADMFDRIASAKVEKLRKEITNFQEWTISLPRMRSEAIISLKDAIQDGTIKVLKSAIRLAKDALLMGDTNNGDGIWALDTLRDSFLELKAAERRKRVIDAQKDLVGKRNKCFVRSEPIGTDRFHSKYWLFDHDDAGRLWVESDFDVLSEVNKPMQTGMTRVDTESLIIGPRDEEEDFLPMDVTDDGNMLKFFCQEYHPSGLMKSLVKRSCGFYTSEKSLRLLIKNMDSKKKCEAALKEEFKKILESSGAVSSSNDDVMSFTTTSKNFSESEETRAFLEAREKFLPSLMDEDEMVKDYLKTLSTAVGQEILLPRSHGSTDTDDLDFMAVKITGWNMKKDANQGTEISSWIVSSDVQAAMEISAHDLFEGLARVARRNDHSQGDYSSLLEYRNKLGKFCGRAADAPYCMSVFNLSKLLLKREQDLYPSLKCRLSGADNHWGGKNGLKNAWIVSLRDYGDRFETVKDCCLLLESAFFEFCGGVTEVYSDDVVATALQLLNDAKSRRSIVLETKGPKIIGLWAAHESRLIFREIVSCAYQIRY